MFRKESKIIVSVGVIEWKNGSEWGATSFAQPKAKTNHVRFFSEFRNLNKHLKLNPYHMPKIRRMQLNLEIFKYATPLEYNMGYYHISLRE